MKRIETDSPVVMQYTLCSDSSVPQNRNKIMFTAITIFIQTSQAITEVIQKHCEVADLLMLDINCVAFHFVFHSHVTQFGVIQDAEAPIFA